MKNIKYFGSMLTVFIFGHGPDDVIRIECGYIIMSRLLKTKTDSSVLVNKNLGVKVLRGAAYEGKKATDFSVSEKRNFLAYLIDQNNVLKKYMPKDRKSCLKSFFLRDNLPSAGSRLTDARPRLAEFVYNCFYYNQPENSLYEISLKEHFKEFIDIANKDLPITNLILREK